MIAAGLDLSLTATGVCVDGACSTIRSKLKGMERLIEIRDRTLRAISPSYGKLGWVPADIVAIENYAFGATRGTHSHALGELGGVVRLALYEANVPYIDVPPAVLKRWAVQKGNAGKDEMIAAAVRAGYQGHDNNEADAWWLQQIAAAKLGQIEVNQERRKMLDKLEILRASTKEIR